MNLTWQSGLAVKHLTRSAGFGARGRGTELREDN